MSWIEFPRPGTSFGDGRWLCTVEVDGWKRVEILELRLGRWLRLPKSSTVTHVDYVPPPAGGAPLGRIPARIQAITSEK